MDEAKIPENAFCKENYACPFLCESFLEDIFYCEKFKSRLRTTKVMHDFAPLPLKHEQCPVQIRKED